MAMIHVWVIFLIFIRARFYIIVVNSQQYICALISSEPYVTIGILKGNEYQHEHYY
jgi:hypothetical protein